MAATITWPKKVNANSKGECEGVGVAGALEFEIRFGSQAGKFDALVRPAWGDGIEGPGQLLAENVSGRTCWQKCVAFNKANAQA